MSQKESSDFIQRKQRLSGIFDGAANTYDHVGPRFFSHFGRQLVEIAEIPRGSKVLDVATGRGALLIPTAESVGLQGNVIGIDLSKKMVQETTKELVLLKMSPNVEVRQMDAEYLQFPDESFDYVLCGFAIFFFPQLELAMSEFRRVLKPTGYICVSTFDKLFDEEWSWFDEIVKNHLPDQPESNQIAEPDTESLPVFDTSEGLTAILKAAGFTDIQIFTEKAEFVYSSKEEFWSTLWSHGLRGTMERIERETGADGLQMFKTEVFRKVGDLKESDGLHQIIPVLVGKSRKQKS